MADIFISPLLTCALSKSVCGFTRLMSSTASACSARFETTTLIPSADGPTSVTSIAVSMAAPMAVSVTP